eukprot:TRINITY_DN561_c0_g1_i1.p1 TRINITY_DN561_c0_g1~~TRINITY_DN561_c0_g1_i1.p1  ORF type:complete len:717 (-),score=192.92 TRINITY_DN561_c0_g1_i1:303-2453(-)
MAHQVLSIFALIIAAASAKPRSVDDLEWGGAEVNKWLTTSPIWTANDTHYVASYRPGVMDEADQIAIWVEPRRLIAIHDVSQTFELEAKVITAWKDPRLEYKVNGSAAIINDKDYEYDKDDFSIGLSEGRDSEADGTYTISPRPGNADPYHRIWTPKLMASLNWISPPEILYDDVQLFTNGVVYTETTMKLHLSQRMDLRKFPLDSHDLVATFMSSRYANEEVRLRLLDNATGADTWSVEPWLEGWNIDDTKHSIGAKVLFTAKGETETFDTYVLSITVSRDPEYYMLNQALPLGVIMAMATTTFIFELNGFEKRVTVLFTSILTLMAFSVYLGESLPRTAYSTGMHIIIYICYVMLVLAVCHVSLIWTFMRDDLIRADEDNDNETTHEEMQRYISSLQKIGEVQENMAKAGIVMQNGTSSQQDHGATRAMRGRRCSISQSACEVCEHDEAEDPSTDKGSREPCQDLEGVEIGLASSDQLAANRHSHSSIDSGAASPVPGISPNDHDATMSHHLAAALSQPEVLNLDLDGDGIVTEEESKFWQALDNDGDGLISVEELLSHTSQIPIDEWTVHHVYLFLLAQDMTNGVAATALRLGVHGGVLQEMDEEGLAEIGIESAVARSKLRFAIKCCKDRTKLNPSKDNASFNLCMLHHATAMKMLVAFDFHLRWIFPLVWLVCVAAVLPNMSDNMYGATFLGVVKNTQVSCGDWCGEDVYD